MRETISCLGYSELKSTSRTQQYCTTEENERKPKKCSTTALTNIHESQIIQTHDIVRERSRQHSKRGRRTKAKSQNTQITPSDKYYMEEVSNCIYLVRKSSNWAADRSTGYTDRIRVLRHAACRTMLAEAWPSLVNEITDSLKDSDIGRAWWSLRHNPSRKWFQQA